MTPVTGARSVPNLTATYNNGSHFSQERAVTSWSSLCLHRAPCVQSRCAARAPSILCADRSTLFSQVSLKYLRPKYVSSIYFGVCDGSSERAGSTSSLSVTLQTPLRRLQSRVNISAYRLKLYLGSVFIEEVRKPGRYATLYASLYGDPRCIPDACGTGTGFSNTIRWISAPHGLYSGHQLCPMGR